MNNPLTKPMVSKPHIRLLISALVFSMILSSCFLLLKVQLEESINEITQDSANQLMTKAEVILNHSGMTHQLIKDDLTKKCNSRVNEKIQNVVAEQLYLRNASFFKNGKIFCSSVPEAVGMPIRSAENFHRNHILLFTDEHLTKGIPLFATRMDENDLGIVSVIDGRYLQNMLEVNNSNTKLVSYLQVGDAWIENSGHVHHSAIPMLDFSSTVQGSLLPITIIVGMKPMHILLRLWSEYKLIIVIITLACFILSVFIHQILASPGKKEKILNAALKNNEFTPWLQGIVNKDEKLCGAEVLMRWQKTSGEIISPDKFIPAAEKCGLIASMTTSMMPKLQDFFIQHEAIIPKGFILSINISKVHFQDMSLVEECRRFLGNFPKNNLVLCLEITERELIEQTPVSSEMLRQLTEMGVKIAIDDFGTGHSSFNYLQNFNVDIIKIDRAYINNIGTESVSASLVDIIIDMASTLKMDVVAEGVETKEQVEYLISRNVTKLQGFYYHKPVPLQVFTNVLEKNKDLL